MKILQKIQEISAWRVVVAVGGLFLSVLYGVVLAIIYGKGPHEDILAIDIWEHSILISFAIMLAFAILFYTALFTRLKKGEWS